MNRRRQSAADREALASEFDLLAQDCNREADESKRGSGSQAQRFKHAFGESSLRQKADQLVLKAIRAGLLTSPIDPWDSYNTRFHVLSLQRSGSLFERTIGFPPSGVKDATCWRTFADGCLMLSAKIRNPEPKSRDDTITPEVNPAQYRAVEKIVRERDDITQQAIQETLRAETGSGINHGTLRDILDDLRAKGVYKGRANRRWDRD
jgi:hypothetical protein